MSSGEHQVLVQQQVKLNDVLEEKYPSAQKGLFPE